MSVHVNGLFPVLLSILSDNSDEVVLQGLAVLAEIVNSTHKGNFFIYFSSTVLILRFVIDVDINKTHYRKFIVSLLNLFSEEKPFLEKRGSLIIR